MEEEQYQEWLARLLAAGLSEEIKLKLVTCKKLSAEEQQQLMHIIDIAEEAKSMERNDALIKVMRRIDRNVKSSLEKQHEILAVVSGDEEIITTKKDRRGVNALKQSILTMTIDEIQKRPKELQRSIAWKFFREFRGHPDFYKDFRIFMRQIYRLLSQSE